MEMVDTATFTGDKTNINDVVEFINKGLSDGFMVQDLRKTLGLSEKTQQKLFKANGYKYNQKLKAYIKADEEVDAEAKTKPTKDPVRSSNTSMIQSNHTTNETAVQGKEMLEILNTMKELKGMQNQFQEMYQWYKLQTDTNIIEIDVPEFKVAKNNNDTISRNLRLYTDTNKLFNEFCKDHKECKIQDILNTALMEFIEKYK